MQTLSRAHEIRQLIRVRYINCNFVRHYLQENLLKVWGTSVLGCGAAHAVWRCKRWEFDADILLPSEAQGMNVRVR